MPSTVEVIVLDPRVRGEAKPGGTWHPGDFELFDSQKGMAKVHRNLNALPHSFDIKVVVSNSIADSRKYGDALPLDPHAINIRYANNATTPTNWIPMTSWILLHRLSHCFVSGHGGGEGEDGLFDNVFPRTAGPEFALFAGLDDLWWDAFEGLDSGHPVLRWRSDGKAYVPEIRGTHFRIRDQYQNKDDFSCFDGNTPNLNRTGFLAMYLMTMRSAREKALSNELDIFAEAFAQFLHTGRFRMNRWAQSGIQELGHTKRFREVYDHGRVQQSWAHCLNQDLSTLRVTEEYLDQRIGEIEAEVNAKMSVLAERMVGKVFSF